MLDSVVEPAFGDIRVTVCENPFEKPRMIVGVHEGATLSDILNTADVKPASYLKIRVVLIKGINISPVPLELWGKVRPKAGTYVHIEPNVQGAVLAPLLSTIVTAAAPAIAGTLFTAGTFAHLLATAAISVLGMLAVRAIIPPPDTSSQAVEEDPTFNIDLAANEAQPFSPYPMCFGRHLVYPLKTAAGYTETVGDEIYLRERMTFGYGPLALETLKIGDTDITEFDDVEIEFLNVNRAETLANMPALAAKMRKKQRQVERPNFRIGDQATDLFDPPPPGTNANEYVFVADEPITQLLFVVEGKDRVTQTPGPWINQRVTSGFEQSGAYTIQVAERLAGSSAAWNVIQTRNIPNGAASEQTFNGVINTSDTNEYRVTIQSGADVVVVRRVVAVFNPANPNSGFRFGTATMSLYPDDISEVDLSILLEAGVEHVRTTAVGVEAAQVDFSFNGLAIYSPKGARGAHTVEIDVEYRQVDDTGAWTLAERKVCTGNTGQFIRFTTQINFPDVDQYDIRVRRFTPDNAASNLRDESTWTTLRNIQPGNLPSHRGIAEVAIRVKASEQLNGRIDSLNAVVQQLAPVYDGSSWSAPQPIRHPAWAYARALMGPMSGHGVGRARIDADGLKDWADNEPWWTCDMWLTGERSMASVLDLIAASGRARRGMSADLKYSVVREFGAAAPVIQHFTPRNSWDFKGIKFLEKELHAIRCRVISEVKGWQSDEVLVYNDGFDEGTATEIETMSLPGVVLSTNDIDQSNVWRLGRYHLAVASLRHEQFSFMTDLDHLPVRYGDKIRIVHDVPLFGIGSGRIVQVDGDNLGLTLDDEIENATEGVNYRVRIRRGNGIEEVHTMEYDGNGRFINAVPTLIGNVNIRDLAMVELTTQETAELLVTSIKHDEDLKAEITAVPAADAVLDADSGPIPDYNPIITDPPGIRNPSKPTVLGIRSNRDTARINRQFVLLPRIGVRIRVRSRRNVEVPLVQIRWRKTGTNRTDWRTSNPRVYREEIVTDRLNQGTEYQVQVRTLNPLNGRSRGWVNAGTATADIGTGELVLPNDWTARGTQDSIVFSGSEAVGGDLKHYRLYGQETSDGSLTELRRSPEPQIRYTPKAADAFDGYRVQAYDHEDQGSNTTSLIVAAPAGIQLPDLPPEIEADIQAAEDLAQQASNEATQAQLDADAAQAEIDGFSADFVGMRAEVLGGNIAEIRLTSWVDPGGNAGSAIQLDADNTIVNGSMAVQKLVVGFGGNLLTDTAFNDGLQEYSTFGGSGGALAASIAEIETFNNTNVLEITQTDGATDGSAFVNHTPTIGLDGSTDGQGIPVEGDAYYCFAAKVRPARCDGALRVQWFDETDTFISNQAVDILSTDQQGAFDRPAQWKRFFIIQQAPTNARKARLRFVKEATLSGEADSNIRFFEPYFGLTHDAATEPNAYGPGGTTYIGSDRIITDAIVARHILARSITADKIAAQSLTAEEIQAGAISTSELAANAITSGKIQAGAVRANEIEARTISADEIEIGGVTFEELANQAATEWNRQAQGSFTPSALGTSETIFTLTLNDTLNSEPWRVVAGGRGNAGGNVNNIAYQFQRRLRRTSTSPWSAWQTIAVSFQFLFDSQYTAFNFFESFGGTWGTVQYRLRASYTTSDSQPGTVVPCQNNYLLAEFSRR